jgi:hypothetical protein
VGGGEEEEGDERRRVEEGETDRMKGWGYGGWGSGNQESGMKGCLCGGLSVCSKV